MIHVSNIPCFTTSAKVFQPGTTPLLLASLQAWEQGRCCWQLRPMPKGITKKHHKNSPQKQVAKATLQRKATFFLHLWRRFAQRWSWQAWFSDHLLRKGMIPMSKSRLIERLFLCEKPAEKTFTRNFSHSARSGIQSTKTISLPTIQVCTCCNAFRNQWLNFKPLGFAEAAALSHRSGSQW